MITLGINAAFHDSAAALVVDGKVMAAAEEERFTRVKHGKRPLPFTAWELPFHAMHACLEKSGICLADVDHVAYSYAPHRFIGQRANDATIELPMEPSAHAPGRNGWDNPWDPLFASYIVNAPRQLASGAPHHLRERFADARHDGPYQFHFVDHHLSHQASAFLASPFDRCAVMTLDGRGEDATTSYGVYRDDAYQPLGEVCMPHSLGLLYEQVTSHLGFLHSSDEYKVMALAALGQDTYRDVLKAHVNFGDGGRYEMRPLNLTAVAGPPRKRGTPLEQQHLDLAASLQSVLEEAVLHLATWLREVSGERRLAMAGGVALNCVMNAKLRDAGIFDDVWVQPAAGDAGTALGAALWIDARERLKSPTSSNGRTSAEHGVQDALTEPVHLATRRWRMEHAYLGPEYHDDEIERLLQWAKLPYRKVVDMPEAAAQLLAKNRILGWFQGRMEFGPRALGARSILASPLNARMQTWLNELKDREDFRPVAPAVPDENFPEWFAPADANQGQSPFMLFVYDVLPQQAGRIPAACHIDRTARVQTVNEFSSPRYHALLRAFGGITGVPVLINTSFNVRGEPIVCTPRDALNAFFSTPLDALAIGSFLLEKHPVS